LSKHGRKLKRKRARLFALRYNAYVSNNSNKNGLCVIMCNYRANVLRIVQEARMKAEWRLKGAVAELALAKATAAALDEEEKRLQQDVRNARMR
jgi:hypothetical protein